MMKWITVCFAVIIILFIGFSSLKRTTPSQQPPASRCQPDQSCWPTRKEWSNLEKQLTGQLVKPVSIMEPCKVDPTSRACLLVLQNVQNPFFLQSNPAGGESQGWYKAWNLQLSSYAVEAETSDDIITAVQFARKYHLRLVIKGAGHDYLGRSNSSNSLLIWTHKMREMEFHDSFICAGCPGDELGISAITVSAGTRWIDVYEEVTTNHNQYVQGGGCASVGAAGGFIQGGGFGSYSKKFGTGAAGVLEMEIVTADGDLIIANRYQNQDLFWAIRGGGGGTFGIVTKMTLKTHPLPEYFVNLHGTITATNDASYKALIQQFITFFYQNLNNENWGEQFSFNADNTIKLSMVSQGLSPQQVEKIWMPFKTWVQKNPQLYSINITSITVPPRQKWDYRFWEKNYPNSIVLNSMAGAPEGEYWWAGDGKEVFGYWYTYQSWWLPTQLFESANIENLSEIFFQASRLAPVGVHINKGLAGASPEAIASTKETSTNPAVYDAVCLVIMAAGSNHVYPDIKGREPNEQEAELTTQNICKAMQLFQEAAPNAGTYVNEADFFQNDWQKTFWGEHYDQLLQVKQKYDPYGLFICHHCVGSEFWSEDGMQRKVLEKVANDETGKMRWLPFFERK